MKLKTSIAELDEQQIFEAINQISNTSAILL